jgi:hypothetical protein
MIVQPDFFNHWKTKRFTALIGSKDAPLLVLKLWAYCQAQRRNRFSFEDERLKFVCEFDGDANSLRTALETCGFIRVNPEEPTGFIVHDWDIVNAALLASWRNGARGGRKPPGYPKITHGQPTPSNHNNKYSTDKIRGVGLPTGSEKPTVLDDSLPEDQRAANRKKLSAVMKDAIEKLKSPTATVQNEEENRNARGDSKR